MLQNPTVLHWLGGVEPAWTLLGIESFNALRHPPSSPGNPLRLAPNLTPEEVDRSAVARNALILLQAAAVGPGLKLTATGNLSRRVVVDMIDIFTWPNFDKAHQFRLHNVVNEPDFLPLFLVRHLVEGAKLLRKRNGHLRTTPAGRRLLEEKHGGGIQAILFDVALWQLDLGYFGRTFHGSWPLHDAGVVLWCLSVAAAGWQTRERLTRLSTVPINGVLDATWDSGSSAMEARILRPLWWFGLLDYQASGEVGRLGGSAHLYRKAPLFDRFLTFEVKLDLQDGPRH